MSTLKELLNNCTKKKLIHLARFHAMKSYSSLKKAELVDKLANHMKSKDVMISFFSYMSEEEISCLHSQKKADIHLLRRLSAAGYIFSEKDQQSTCLIPEDLPLDYLSEERFKKTKKENSLFLDLLTFAGTVYGSIPLSALCKMYTSYSKHSLSLEDARSAFSQIPSSMNPMILTDDLCIQKDFMENDLYQKILLCQGSIPYYMPSYDDFVHFLRHGFFEDDYTKQVKDYLLNYRNSDSSKVTDIIISLQATFRQGGTLAEAGEILRQQKFLVTMESDKALLSLLNGMFSHSRLLLNRGYTESEKVSMKKVTTVTNAGKVYPNSPCPCGSGKKYKKCCGRK